MADAPVVPATPPATPLNGKPPTGTEVPTTPPKGATAKPVVPPKPTAVDPLAAKGKAPDAQAAPGEPKAVEDLFELVVDGEKQTLTREQAVRQLQKGVAGDKRLREANEKTAQVQRALTLGKEDPASLLKYLGVEPKAFAEKLLAQEAEAALMDPKDRQLMELQRENEGFKKQQEAGRKTQEQQAQDAQDKQVFSAIEKSFIAAAEAGGLAGTPDNLMRMVEVANEAVELGIPITEQQIVAEVREREDASFQRLEAKVLGGLKGEALAKRLGPAVVEAILTWSVEQIRGGSPYKAPPAEAPAPPNGSARPRWINEAEFLNRKR